MSSKTVAVVTGGAGFIGSHVTDLLLNQGFEVRVIDNLSGGRRENLEQHSNNSSLSLDERDICTFEPSDSIFKDTQFVFHFAGIGDIVPSIDAPLEYMRINVQGTVRMLEAARFSGVEKFVYAASSSCYGLAEQVPTTESAPIDLQYPYALSKYQGEQAVLHWARVYNLPALSLRIFNAYGPRSKTNGAYGAVFGVFLKQKLAGQPFTIVGDGTQKRDFLFVTDIAQAFYQAAKSDQTNEIFNLGAGNPQSVNYLAELLGNENGVVYIPKRPGEPDATWADISKIKTAIKWQPSVSFPEGVSIMLQNIDYWKNAPLWDVNSISKATEGWFSALGGS